MRKLNVVLVDPNQDWVGIATGGGSYATEALGYMAAITESQGHTAKIIHQQQGRFSDEAIEMIGSKADVVGLSVMAYNYSRAMRIIGEIKKKSPSTVIVVGGALPTGLPEMFKGNTIDLIAMGEGESTFAEILHRISAGASLSGISGTARTEAGQLVFEAPVCRIKNPDEIPFPIQDEAAIANSRMCGSWMAPTYEQRVACVTYSRGCTGRCKFCVDRVIWNGISTWRSPSNFVDEVEKLQDSHAINALQISDATFNINPARVRALCEEIIKRKVQIGWFVFCDPGLANQSDELLDLMRAAGCRKMGLGVEDPLLRLNLQKRSDSMDRVQGFIERIAKRGIIARGYFMIGHPEQRDANFEAIKDFMQKVPIDEIRVSVYTPLPGTPSWKEFDYVVPDPTIILDRFDTNTLVVRGPYTPDEIQKIRRDVARSFFCSEAYRSRKSSRIQQGFHPETYAYLESQLRSKGYID